MNAAPYQDTVIIVYHTLPQAAAPYPLSALTAHFRHVKVLLRDNPNGLEELTTFLEEHREAAAMLETLEVDGECTPSASAAARDRFITPRKAIRVSIADWQDGQSNELIVLLILKAGARRPVARLDEAAELHLARRPTAVRRI